MDADSRHLKAPVNMEYDDGRDKRHSGDGVEREPNMLQVDRVVRLVARAVVRPLTKGVSLNP